MLVNFSHTQRESSTRGTFLPVSSGQSLCFTWFWVHLRFISGLPRVGCDWATSTQGSLTCVHLLVEMDSSERGLWVGWHHLLWGGAPSLLTSRSLSVRVQSRWSLWSQEWGLWGLLSHLGRAQCLLPPAIVFVSEYLFTGDRLQLLSLGSIHLLPQIREMETPRNLHWEDEGWRSVFSICFRLSWSLYSLPSWDMEMLLCPIKRVSGWLLFIYFSRICYGSGPKIFKLQQFLFILANSPKHLGS